MVSSLYGLLGQCLSISPFGGRGGTSRVLLGCRAGYTPCTHSSLPGPGNDTDRGASRPRTQEVAPLFAGVETGISPEPPVETRGGHHIKLNNPVPDPDPPTPIGVSKSNPNPIDKPTPPKCKVDTLKVTTEPSDTHPPNPRATPRAAAHREKTRPLHLGNNFGQPAAQTMQSPLIPPSNRTSIENRQEPEPEPEKVLVWFFTPLG
ncbi:hypothetical protein CRENBAI_012825 [Crenichthys baileyi]|uniref:Uncharacterized protein n=1 Tax=Crenichthys baileyi TaxID=28760 RepID=A0AAV9RK23_9TELE